MAARALSRRFGGWNASIGVTLALIAWFAIVMAIFPALGDLHKNVVQYGTVATETPQPLKNALGQIVYPGFPADVLFKFRLYSVIDQLMLWSTIRLTFGLLAERALRPKRDPATERLSARLPVTEAPAYATPRLFVAPR